MRRSTSFFGLVVTVLAACADAPTAPPVASPQMAAFTETTSERIPIDIAVIVPCAANGAGEIVQLSGELHILNHVTATPKGFVEVTHANPQGVRGTGLTTGVKYQGTGVAQEVVTVHAAETTTFINNFRIIGQGPRNNLLVHMVTHITITPSGKVMTVEHTSIECR